MLETFPDEKRVRALVAAALEEDGAASDVTVAYLDLAPRRVCAHIVAGESGILAGVDVARLTFEERDAHAGFDRRIEDGTPVRPGDLVAVVTGTASAVLSAERVALNFLQHLSGVASVTSRFVAGAKGTGTAILDTRKTVPLLRELERYAVRIGGGVNHRFNLSDMILIKENHVRAAGGPKQLIEFLKKRKAPAAIELEVDSLVFLEDALGVPVDRIMLDNFTVQEVRQAVEMVTAFHARAKRPRPEIEVSGGIQVDTVAEYAMDGVDFISVGALTHSAPALDFGLEVVEDGG